MTTVIIGATTMGTAGGDRSPQLLRPWDHRWIGPFQLLGPVRQCNVHIIGGKWIHSDVSAADQFTCSRIGPHDLRSRMKQNRLNHLTVLHVHNDKVDTLDDDEIAKAFIAKCDSRHATFGRL